MGAFRDEIDAFVREHNNAKKELAQKNNEEQKLRWEKFRALHREAIGLLDDLEDIAVMIVNDHGTLSGYLSAWYDGPNGLSDDPFITSMPVSFGVELVVDDQEGIYFPLMSWHILWTIKRSVGYQYDRDHACWYDHRRETLVSIKNMRDSIFDFVKMIAINIPELDTSVEQPTRNIDI